MQVTILARTSEATVKEILNELKAAGLSKPRWCITKAGIAIQATKDVRP